LFPKAIIPTTPDTLLTRYLTLISLLCQITHVQEKTPSTVYFIKASIPFAVVPSHRHTVMVSRAFIADLSNGMMATTLHEDYSSVGQTDKLRAKKASVSLSAGADDDKNATVAIANHNSLANDREEVEAKRGEVFEFAHRSSSESAAAEAR
jgi:hypothetical protein